MIYISHKLISLYMSVFTWKFINRNFTKWFDFTVNLLPPPHTKKCEKFGGSSCRKFNVLKSRTQTISANNNKKLHYIHELVAMAETCGEREKHFQHQQILIKREFKDSFEIQLLAIWSQRTECEKFGFLFGKFSINKYDQQPTDNYRIYWLTLINDI